MMHAKKLKCSQGSGSKRNFYSLKKSNIFSQKRSLPLKKKKLYKAESVEKIFKCFLLTFCGFFLPCMYVQSHTEPVMGELQQIR